MARCACSRRELRHQLCRPACCSHSNTSTVRNWRLPWPYMPCCRARNKGCACQPHFLAQRHSLRIQALLGGFSVARWPRLQELTSPVSEVSSGGAALGACCRRSRNLWAAAAMAGRAAAYSTHTDSSGSVGTSDREGKMYLQAHCAVLCGWRQNEGRLGKLGVELCVL